MNPLKQLKSKPATPQSWTDNDSVDSASTTTMSALSSSPQYVCSGSNFPRVFLVKPVYRTKSGSLTFDPPQSVTCVTRQTRPARLVDGWNTEMAGANETYVANDINLAIFKTCCWPHNVMSDELAKWLVGHHLLVAMKLGLAPIFADESGRLVRLCNLDSSSPSGTEEMIGILVENEAGRHQRWKLAQIYSAEQVHQQFNVSYDLFPLSPRYSLVASELGECNVWRIPVGLSVECADLAIAHTNWKKMIHRTDDKAANKRRETWRLEKRIEFWRMLDEIIKLLLCGLDSLVVLVMIVNYKKGVWLEWRRFINVGEKQVAIGLRWLQHERRWKLTGLFDDATRMYRNHRLVGNLPLVKYTRYELKELQLLITTPMDRL